MPKLIINSDRCKGCELCIAFCPRDNLKLSEGLTSRGMHPVEVCDADACTGCKLCVLMCPDVAISIYREVAEEAKTS